MTDKIQKNDEYLEYLLTPMQQTESNALGVREYCEYSNFKYSRSLVLLVVLMMVLLAGCGVDAPVGNETLVEMARQAPVSYLVMAWDVEPGEWQGWSIGSEPWSLDEVVYDCSLRPLAGMPGEWVGGCLAPGAVIPMYGWTQLTYIERYADGTAVAYERIGE